MKIRPHHWLARRVFAAVMVLSSAGGAAWAESIIFTRPAISIAAPSKEDDSLPKARREEMDFSPPLQRPIVTQPQVISRAPTRSRDPDAEENKHWLLRDHTKIPDPLGKDFLKPPQDKLRTPWKTREATEQEEARSLSPVTSFDWRERERERDLHGRKKDSWAEKRLQRREREEQLEPDPFALRKEKEKDKDAEQRDPFQSTGLFNPQTLRPNEKPSIAEVERRAAFEELLNPRPSVAIKQRSSLEPVTGFDSPRPTLPPVAVPALGQARLGRGPVDPTTSFNERQERLRSPGLEDPNAKYASPTKSSATKTTTEPAFSTPLLRQPATRDFPGRSF